MTEQDKQSPHQPESDSLPQKFARNIPKTAEHFHVLNG